MRSRLASGSLPLRRATGLSLSLLLASTAFALAPPVAGALTLELPVAKVEVSLPVVTLPTVEVPSVKVELPVAKVELPATKVELPAAKVELPAAKVEVPGVASAEVETPSQTQTTSSPTGNTPPVRVTPSKPAGAESTSASGTAAGAASATRTTTAARPATTSATPAATPAATVSAQTPSAQALSSTPSARRHRAAGNRGAGTPGRAAIAAARAVPAAGARVDAALRQPAAAHARAARSSDPLDAIGRHIPLPLPVPDWSKPIILLLLLLALWLGVRSRLAAVRARRLEAQRVTLLQDIGVMQATLVPEIPRRVGDVSVSVAYRPAEGLAAGGDFYDVFALDSGRVAMILGDVAGHGNQALAQAALTRYTLRAYIQAGLEPRAALALAGSVLADATAAHFATVVVALYDPADASLTYASAGHPSPIARGMELPEPLTVCCSPPVGWDVPTGRRQTTVSLPAGGSLCFFSDGLIEARVPDGLLGRERLSEIVAGLAQRASASELLAQVQGASEATPDDMVACIVSPLGGSAATGCATIEELELDLDGRQSDRTSAFLEACSVPAREIAHARDRLAKMQRSGELTALVRVERPLEGAGAVAVLAGDRQRASAGAVFETGDELGEAHSERLDDPRDRRPAGARQAAFDA